MRKRFCFWFSLILKYGQKILKLIVFFVLCKECLLEYMIKCINYKYFWFDHTVLTFLL